MLDLPLSEVGVLAIHGRIDLLINVETIMERYKTKIKAEDNMHVTIDKVEAYSEGILVKFTSEYGEGYGIWNGNKKPMEKEGYNIEFDITDTLQWGKDVSTSKENSFKIIVGEGTITITGKVERLSQDGYAEFRFGESLIQLELEGKGIPIGKFVDVETNELELYAY